MGCCKLPLVNQAVTAIFGGGRSTREQMSTRTAGCQPPTCLLFSRRYTVNGDADGYLG